MKFGADRDLDPWIHSPYIWLMDPDADPDPAIFVSNLQDVNKKKSCFAYYFLKVHFLNFSKIKSHKEVKKQ